MYDAQPQSEYQIRAWQSKKKKVCILLNYACLLLSSQFSIVSPLKLCRWRLPPPLFSLPPPPPSGHKFWLVPRPSNFSPFVYTSDRKKSLVHIAWELALCEVDHQILKAPYNGCSCGPQPKVICRRGIFFRIMITRAGVDNPSKSCIVNQKIELYFYYLKRIKSWQNFFFTKCK